VQIISQKLSPAASITFAVALALPAPCWVPRVTRSACLAAKV